MKKKFVGLLTVMCMLAAFAPWVNAEVVTYEHLTFDTDTGTIIICDENISGELTIPSTINGIKVLSIGDMAFYDCDELTKVTIPNTVTSIGYRAFCFCSNLENIIIPNSVSFVGSSAFHMTSWFMNQKNEPIYINKVLYYYPCSNYEDISKKSSYSIKDGTTSISADAFSWPWAGEGNPYLREITIPDSVTEIGGYAFMGCYNLETVYLSKNIQYVPDALFGNCSNLKDIYYNGTKEQWNNLKMGDYNNEILNATIHYASAPVENNPQIISATASKNGSSYVFNVQTADVAADCQLITELYSGGKIICVKSTQLKVGDIAKTVSVTADSATSAKVFIWDSISGMRPLCNTVTIDEADFITE